MEILHGISAIGLGDCFLGLIDYYMYYTLYLSVGFLFRYQRLVFRHKLYQLREERDMKPETFASLVSAILYEKRSVTI